MFTYQKDDEPNLMKRYDFMPLFCIDKAKPCETFTFYESSQLHKYPYTYTNTYIHKCIPIHIEKDAKTRWTPAPTPS